MKIPIEHLNKIRGQNVLVIGDLMLDVYLHGSSSRISPEAPVPVILSERTEYIPGGAANVINNMSKLGCRMWGSGFMGNDDGGDHLEKILSNILESTESIIRCDLPTIQKTRILADGHHMVRYDEDSDFRKLPEIQKANFQDFISCLLETKHFSCVVLSDYNKGTLTQEVINIVKSKFNGPIICDVKPVNAKMFHNTSCIAPNLIEAQHMCGIHSGKLNPEQIARKIKSDMQLNFIVITLSDHGILFIDEQDKFHAYEAYTKMSDQNPNARLDVTGAGDTVLATLAACIGAKMSLAESVWVANVAAGIVVKKVGTSVCSYDELICELEK